MASNKFLSIDIGTHSTKIVEGKYNKHKVIIEKAFKVDTPRNSVDNGSIANKVMLHSQLAEAIKTHGIKAKDVNCTINSSNIINREIEIPRAAATELDTLIKFEIQQYLPIRIEDYILQYSIIGEFIDELSEGVKEKIRIIVTALPIHMVKAYMELFNDLGLKPNALDVNFNSIRKLFKNNLKINDQDYNTNDTIALIDFGADSLEIDIVKNGKIHFTRMIMYGGRDIDKKLAEIHGISEVEAEKFKIKEADLTQELEEITIENDKTTYYVKEAVDEWFVEINKILKYYKNKDVGNKIDKICIHGGSTRIKGIEKYLEASVGMQINRVIQMDNIEMNKNIDSDTLDLYLNAIGAIIRF